MLSDYEYEYDLFHNYSDASEKIPTTPPVECPCPTGGKQAMDGIL
jgi:hypothetical protein